jgi:hypothetical protein
MSWNDYETAAKRGPVALFFKVLLPILLILFVLTLIGKGCGWFGEAEQVAREEFGPRELLRKYEWFKDAAAMLDKKQADVAVYDGRLKSIIETYTGMSRSQWPREDREQYNIWSSEVAGIKASYNMLAAEYNANMAKFNWRFTNAGDLPKGAETPLPREFKPYTNE